MSKIITAPNEVLSQKANPYIFKNSDPDLSFFLKDMEKALLSASDPKGVGLAAPQIGKSLRIFIAKPTEKSKIFVFINPEIINVEIPNTPNNPNSPKTKKGLRKLEGCLSLPNIWGEVTRAPWVIVKFQTPKGDTKTEKFKGFMAIIVQHEIDHLDGVLFPKRVLEQGGRLYKSHKNEKGKDEFEEISI